jgi:hypothetical protein
MSYTTCLANDPRDRRDRDCKLVGFTTTYAIGAYHHQRCVFELRSVVLDTTLFDEVSLLNWTTRTVCKYYAHVSMVIKYISNIHIK